MWCEINGLWINIMVRMSKTILHVDDNKRRRGYCISYVHKNVQVPHSFAPRCLYYMHFLRKLSALCTKALKCLNKNVLWRVGNVDFVCTSAMLSTLVCTRNVGVCTVCTTMCNYLHWQRVISV